MTKKHLLGQQSDNVISFPDIFHTAFSSQLSFANSVTDNPVASQLMNWDRLYYSYIWSTQKHLICRTNSSKF